MPLDTIAPSRRKQATQLRGLVFLSHSSRIRNKDELTPPDKVNRHLHRKRYLTELLKTVREKLAVRSFDVWVDKIGMHAGDKFDAVIYDALARCRVAVVMVDRDALESDYVRREVTILMWRSLLGDDLTILPVLLGDVTDTDLAESSLGKNTGISVHLPLRPSARKANATTAHQTAEEIAGAVEQQIMVDVGTPDSLTVRWIDDVTHFLDGVPENILWRAAEKAGTDRDEWDRTRNKQRALAAMLLSSADTNCIYNAVREVIRYIDPHRARLTVDRALPLWVDLSVARKVLSSAELPYDQRILGLKTRAYRLGKHIVARATASSPEYTILSLPDVVGEASLDEVMSRYDRTLREELHMSVNESPEEILTDMSLQFRGVYALIRCDTFDSSTSSAIIERLQTAFPGIIFILLANRSSRIWNEFTPMRVYEEFDKDTELRARKYVSRTSELIDDRVLVDSDE